MNSRNSKTSNLHALLLNFSYKTDLKRSDKYVALSNLGIYYALKNMKRLYKNNKSKLSAPRWNDKLELPDGPYPISDIQDYFEYILKNMEKRLIILH